MKKCLAFALLLALFLLQPCTAYADSMLARLEDAADLPALTEGLTEEEKTIMGAPDAAQYEAGGALRRLLQYGKEQAVTALRAQFAFAARLIALVFFCALADAMSPQSAAKSGISLAACACAALWLAGDWDSGIAQTTGTLQRLADYSGAALPVLYTAAAAAGALSSAPVKFAACSLAMEVLMTLSRDLILPMIYACLALSLTVCICDNPILRGLQRLIRWAAVTAMSAVTTAFCLYAGLSGVVAGSADALAVKAARSVLSGALPVVGGILSDSAATLLSAAGVIRSTAGVFSLLAVLLLCAGPFVFLSVKMLLLRAVSTLAELLPGGLLSRFLGECSTVFALLLGLLGCHAAMLFFSLTAGMRAVSAG